MKVPETLRRLTYTIERHEELQSINPVVSYSLLLHALQQAFALRGQGKATDVESTKCLQEWMDRIENLPERQIPKPEAAKKLEAFAVSVFINADRADKSGQHGKATAQKFRAAACFLEALNAYADHVDLEVYADKIKYSKFRAAKIMQSVMTGDEPEGPPVITDEERAIRDQLDALDGSMLPTVGGDIDDIIDDVGYSQDGPPEATQEPKQSPPQFLPKVAEPEPEPMPVQTPAELTPEMVTQLQRYIKIVNSAIDFKDLKGARDNLKLALDVLPAQ